MSQRTLVPALLLIGVGVVLGTTVFRNDIAQATGLSPSVTVVNSPADPVPVREQGTVPVTGTIGISTDGNGVRELNSVALRPFSQNGFATFGAGNPGAFNAEVDLFTVPSGERVVVVYAAVDVHIPTGEHAIARLVRSPAGADVGFIPLTDAGEFNLVADRELLTGGGPVTAVYSPGDHIVVHAFRSQGDGDNVGMLRATVSGYTVPMS